MDFETIYLTYKDDVYRFLYKLCNHQADLADDLTQETFLKVYLTIDQFRGDSQFKTWLFAIPLLALYNGKKGGGSKYFFYIFYSSHIYALYLLAYFLLENGLIK